jgi:hypothetical protein
MTIRGAPPERYKTAARQARATVVAAGSPFTLMPPPKAAITSALSGNTGPMPLKTPLAATLRSRDADAHRRESDRRRAEVAFLSRQPVAQQASARQH